MFITDPDPKRQFPRVRIKPVQQEVLKLRSHAMRLTKEIDLGTLSQEYCSYTDRVGAGHEDGADSRRRAQDALHRGIIDEPTVGAQAKVNEGLPFGLIQNRTARRAIMVPPAAPARRLP